MPKLYLTGSTASRGGLKMGDMRIWPNIREAIDYLGNGKSPSVWANRIYVMGQGDVPPQKIDIGKLGFRPHYVDEKWFAARPKTKELKGDTHSQWELHELYGKHEYVGAINKEHTLAYCPSCGGFGFKVITNGKDPTVALHPTDMDKIYYTDLLMEYLPPTARRALGSYLKARGYGRLNPEKLAHLEALMEMTDA